MQRPVRYLVSKDGQQKREETRSVEKCPCPGGCANGGDKGQKPG